MRRFTQLADLLDIRSGQQILEIGGGRGVFAEIICDRLATGRYVGVDRSSKAVSAARERNQRHVAVGIADFRTGPLDRLEADGLGRFDTIVAVNVNLFWTGTAPPELDLLRRLLRAEGRLWIAYNYGTVAGEERRRLTSTIGGRLEEAGFSWRLVDQEQIGGAYVLVARHT